ncbi:MAG: HAD hydrolase family protein [Candidatus Cloacimonetes bacterium]|nr:HAD hydrolase family protein [Candidatus Cloacimonadota bacterium]
MKIDQISLIITDCDGVLSDGKVIYGSDGSELKNFSAKDGLGIRLLGYTDIKIAVITGRSSEALIRRCSDLRISLLFQKIHNKKKCAEKLLNDLGLKWENTAVIGDDWNDYPILHRAALSAAPADAPSDLQDKVDLVTSKPGGAGAVRELIEYIIKAKGVYEQTIRQFINDLENS